MKPHIQGGRETVAAIHIGRRLERHSHIQGLVHRCRPGHAGYWKLYGPGPASARLHLCKGVKPLTHK
ncbi:MAG: hypothetical protein WCG94_02435 [Methanothrix sp.]